MRFLRFIPGKLSRLKKIRIGFSLLKHSFKTVYFSHHHYFFLCFLITAIQYLHLKLTGFFFLKLKLSTVMAELLAGENFFEILFFDAQFYLSNKKMATFSSFASVLYLQICLTLFILCAVAHYTYSKSTMIKSIQKSLSHWTTICLWAVVEMCAQALTAFLDIPGNLFYFIWSLITVFSIQIIAFDNAGPYKTLKKCWFLFQKRVGQIVALDVIIEGALIATGFIIYAASTTYISQSFTDSSYNDIVIIVILYVISSVMIVEVVTFTNLYKTIEKPNKNTRL